MYIHRVDRLSRRRLLSLLEGSPSPCCLRLCLSLPPSLSFHAPFFPSEASGCLSSCPSLARSLFISLCVSLCTSVSSAASVCLSLRFLLLCSAGETEERQQELCISRARPFLYLKIRGQAGRQRRHTTTEAETVVERERQGERHRSPRFTSKDRDVRRVPYREEGATASSLSDPQRSCQKEREEGETHTHIERERERKREREKERERETQVGRHRQGQKQSCYCKELGISLE